METIGKEELPGLFAQLRDTFAEQRDFLIALDGKVGDSDLGLTMNKAFVAAYDSVLANESDPVGRTLQLAGMAIAKAAPSTMGTLMATGFMRGGKALETAQALGSTELSCFWRAFLLGVSERGKAKPGDKTLVDVLVPVVNAVEVAAQAGMTLTACLSEALRAAGEGLESTKGMVAQHGKAACFQDKTLGLQDAGATAAYFLVATMQRYVSGCKTT